MGTAVMRACIIGGAGFAGGYLAAHLADTGYEVLVTKMPQEQAVQAQAAGATVRDLDILDREAVRDVLKTAEPDYVFHLAAQSSVAASWKDPQTTIDINIKGSTNVLDALRGMDKKPRVLLTGSGEEYGNIPVQEIPVREGCALKPCNIYAATKACQNMIGSIYAKAYGLEVVMVRAFNHIGPGQAPVFVASDFCRQAAEIEAGRKEAVIRAGNLAVRRDFTDVRDIVRAYVMLVQNGRAGETYNIGSGHAVSIGDILKIVLDKSTAHIRIEVAAEKLRPVDMPVMEADIQKMQTLTGWEPKIRLEQTIEETLDYWRERLDTGK